MKQQSGYKVLLNLTKHQYFDISNKINRCRLDQFADISSCVLMMISSCSTKKSNTASEMDLSTLNICVVSSLLMMPSRTDSRIMVSFIIMYCLNVMFRALQRSSSSRFTKSTRFQDFSTVGSLRILLVQIEVGVTILSEPQISISFFFVFQSFFFLFCSQSSTSPKVLNPFFLSYLSSSILWRISFSLMMPWTSFSCSSAVLKRANTFIILQISFSSLVLVLSNLICSLRSSNFLLMTNYFLFILQLSL